MRITIKAIDEDSVQALGYTPTPSYAVEFTSTAINGQARFVPASGSANDCVGQVFDVEVNQERVSAFKMAEGKPFVEAVTSLPEKGSFHVQGVVVSVVPLSEPVGNEVASVSAGEALFMLTSEELGGAKLIVGERITFVAHELSLWDEAI
jgi:hypothetical protein